MKRFLLGLVAGALCGAAAMAPRPAQAQEPGNQPKSDDSREQPIAVRVTPEMRRYSQTRYALYFVISAANMVVLLLLLRGRVSARLRDLAGKHGRNGLLRAYIYYPLFTLLYGLITLPLTFYSSFLLPHQYGQSNQSLGGWVLDGAKAFGISSILGPPVIALLYWTIRRSPRRWWFGFWLATIPLLTLSILLAPIIIDPLFNKYEPLRNIELRDRILALASKAGIERSRVFEVDASRRTKSVNAYVTGIGGSARIVLWDTLLQKLNQDEVLFVMAHEMGHYVEGHVPLLLLGSIAGSLVVLWLTDAGTRRLLAKYGERWQVRDVGDLASFPALTLVLALLNFLGTPVEAGISRYFEHRADTFGLRITENGRAGASSFVKLSELNLSDPEPPKFVEFWMFTHPTLKERIDYALEWDREHQAPR